MDSWAGVSIYQVLSLLLLAAVIAFTRLSYPRWIIGMSGREDFALKGTSRQAEQEDRDLHVDAVVLWPDPGKDTVTSTHARLSPGWQAGQRRLGGPALFTLSAACTGLFKQSGCFHKLSLSLWASSGRRMLMWPFPWAPWTVHTGERNRQMLPAAGLPSSQLFDQILTVGQNDGGTASKSWPSGSWD